MWKSVKKYIYRPTTFINYEQIPLLRLKMFVTDTQNTKLHINGGPVQCFAAYTYYIIFNHGEHIYFLHGENFQIIFY